MIKISRRQRIILDLLVSENQYVKIDTLANKVDVSNRTIRNDLGQISAFLRENGYQLETKTHNGIRVIVDQKDIEKLKEIIHKNGLDEIEGKGRIDFITLLLLSNEYSTYQQIADDLAIAKQTVVNVFEEVEERLVQYHLTLVKQQGLGIRVKGQEKDIRNCFRKTLTSDTIESSVVEKISEHLSKYMDKSEMLISLLINNKGIVFTEKDKIRVLVAHLLQRSALNKTVEITRHLMKYENSGIYKCLKENNTDELDEGNLLYLTSLITANGTFNGEEAVLASERDKEDAREITGFLFEKLHQLDNIQLQNKEQFIEGLSIHLASAIYRLRNNIVVNNDLLSQIKYRIALMYEFTKQQLLLCEKDYGLEFNENEIAYIAMYLTSAYEGSIRDEFSCRVLLVCSFGLTTSAILKSRIVQNIPECSIFGPMNLQEAKMFLQNHDVDLIVSTVDFSNEKFKTIVVNPLLTIEDITSIKESIVQISFDVMCEKFLIAYKKTTENKGEVSIKDTTSKERIHIVDSIEDWQQAIRLAAKPLLLDGSLEKRYVDKMIEAVNEYGPYMVLAPSVAFVHAGVDDGINRECSSILVIKKPIVFGEKNQKLVRAIIVMGVKDKNNNSLLNNVYIMQSNENQKTLCSDSITIDDILNMKVERE